MTRINNKFLLPFILLAFALLSSACNSGAATEDTTAEDRLQVRAAFNNYKRAALASEGEVAVAQLSSNSLAYYDQLLKLALEADKPNLLALSSGDLVQVLAMRLAFTKEELLQYNGRQIFQAMADNQMIVDDQLEKMKLGVIVTQGKKAKGRLILNDKKTPIFFDFKQEADGWKLDVTTTVIMTTKYVERQAQAANLPVPVFLEETLQLTDDQKAALWNPL